MSLIICGSLLHAYFCAGILHYFFCNGRFGRSTFYCGCGSILLAGSAQTGSKYLFYIKFQVIFHKTQFFFRDYQDDNIH